MSGSMFKEKMFELNLLKVTIRRCRPSVGLKIFCLVTSVSIEEQMVLTAKACPDGQAPRRKEFTRPNFVPTPDCRQVRDYLVTDDYFTNRLYISVINKIGNLVYV